MHETPISRRNWLKTTLFSASCLGLRSLVSGLPLEAIANPGRWIASLDDSKLQAMAQDSSLSGKPQFLVLSASDQGEPINCNVPGMYLGQGFLHPTTETMAQTTFMLGSKSATAAKVWTNLGGALSRTCFFHHATNSFAHGDMGSIHRLGSTFTGNEMMVSAFGKALAPALKTIQSQPINISQGGGTELISCDGVQQPMFSPTAMRNMLTTGPSLAAFAKSQALRDRDIDALHALAKAKASKPQLALIDSLVLSQAQARAIPAALLANLQNITDDSIISQMTTAALLCQMRLTPAVVVHLGFGGDNHTDNNSHDGPGALPAEAAQHNTAVAAINTLFTATQKAQMTDEVTFATLSTFGRSNAPPDLSGRAHNGLHTCNLIIGSNVNASVVGGAKLVADQNAPQALDIDPATGGGADGSSIKSKETLAAFGATVGGALGLSESAVKALLPTGVRIPLAIKS